MVKICMMVTNPCVNDARVLKEAGSLSKNGYELVVLGINDKGIPEFQQKQGFCIKRINRKMKHNSLLGKIEYAYKFIYRGIKEKADIYHAHDLSTLLECYIASRWNGAKLVYDSHELNILVYDGYKKYVNIYYYIERLLINKTNAIITVNEFIADELKKRYNIKSEITTLMNTPLLGKTDSLEMCSQIEDKIIDKVFGKTVIIYQGVMQAGRGLPQIIQAMNYLDDSYFLLMVGDGPLKSTLEGIANDGKSKNIHFTGLVDHSLLFGYTKIAKIGVIPLENVSLSFYYSAPNKLFEYIHCNVPVLASNFPFISGVITKYNVGMLIEKIEPEQIANAIKKMLADKEQYSIMRANTYEAKKELNWEIEEKKLLALYRNL